MLKTQADKTSYKILLNSGLASRDELDKIAKDESDPQVTFSAQVVHAGLIREKELLDLYARSMGTAVISLRSMQVDKDLLQRIPVKFAWYYKLFPVTLLGRKLVVAVSQILDVNTLDEIRFGIGFDIETRFAPESEIEEMLKAHYGLGAETLEKMLAQSPKQENSKSVEPGDKVQDLEELAEKTSVIQLVNQIVLEAYKKRASDIHIEPDKGKVRLRYRIDGILHEAKVPPEMDRFLVAILSRFKIMANLNIVEKRLPQDGKARVKVQQESLDLRISSIPTPYGESMVIRILPNRMEFSLEKLGFNPRTLEIFLKLLARPNGVIFVTGPTGSGKSTTLYGALRTIDTVRKKVITIEDPVEYEMSSIMQIQVAADIGLTFAQGLRSVLRHDPDIMMVGEVRDLETADIAIRASLTGHLMLSTLHTNDAAGGITRLIDIGVEPYLIASSVVGFLAQRLVRVICLKCKEEDKTLTSELRSEIAVSLAIQEGTIKTFRGRGCHDCHETGYMGRAAVHEMLVVSEEIRTQVMARTNADEIKRKARAAGMETLRQDGWRKVLEGRTTPEEVLQMTPPDEDSSTVDRSSRSDSVTPVSGVVETEVAAAALSKSFKNRRKYMRIDVHLTVLFRTVELEGGKRPGGEWKGDGKTMNVSAGGISLLTETPLYPEDLLDLKIDLDGTGEPIDCIGKVLRVASDTREEASSSSGYRAAVLFLAIHSSDRLKIEQFCSERKQDETV